MKLKLSDQVTLAVAARAIRLLPLHLQQESNADDMLYMLHGESVGVFHEFFILQQAHRMVTGLIEASPPWYQLIDSPNVEKDVLAECEKCAADAMALPLSGGLVAPTPTTENAKIATPRARRRTTAKVKRGNRKR